jgi:hypothetical protein
MVVAVGTNSCGICVTILGQPIIWDLPASPFISGLDRTQMGYIKEDAEKKFSPNEYNERQSLRNLRERLSNAGTHYLNHLQSIIPVPNLREAEGARALKTLREGK